MGAGVRGTHRCMSLTPVLVRTSREASSCDLGDLQVQGLWVEAQELVCAQGSLQAEFLLAQDWTDSPIKSFLCEADIPTEDKPP